MEEEEFNTEDDYYRVAYAVLNHHHHTNNTKETDEKEELIDDFVEKFELEELDYRMISELNELKKDSVAQLIKGLLHKCDYSASGDYIIEYPNDFLAVSLDKYMKNLGFEKNELQEFTSTNTDENIVVVANTGMGKTEAGLLWIGDNKGFFILPLRTAINAIYERVSKKIVKNSEDKVGLLHSDSLSAYLADESVIEEEKAFEYNRKGKNLSLPLTISTLDQLFDFVYKYNGFELKLATLSYSKIVIDEIQAYSPDLLAYLISGLERITKVGGKFAILTATLPPFVRGYIEKVTDVKYAKFTKGKSRHNLKIISERISSKVIWDYYMKNKDIENKRKILIVCNTIKEAQKLYGELLEKKKENYTKNNICENDICEKNVKIELIHSKVIKKHRSEKEEKILEFGKTENIEGGIWIGTSIVEASLDIDFDCLFTELLDLSSLFQRLGRVNRKGQKSIEEVNTYVFTEIDNKLLINENETRGFIDPTIYELSKEALGEVNGILSEDKKIDLIEKYLTSENLKGSKFNKKYTRVKTYIDDLYIGEKDEKEVKKIFRNITSYKVIPISIYDDKKEKIDTLVEIIKTRFKYNRDISEKENTKKRTKLKILQEKSKVELDKYTVNVGIYDLNGNEYLNLGYEKIKLVRCDYTYKLGFIRVPVVKEKETFDAFI
jgi:CRISPR-associated endonuclease/helicase Cas3